MKREGRVEEGGDRVSVGRWCCWACRKRGRGREVGESELEALDGILEVFGRSSDVVLSSFVGGILVEFLAGGEDESSTVSERVFPG